VSARLHQSEPLPSRNRCALVDGLIRQPAAEDGHSPTISMMCGCPAQSGSSRISDHIPRVGVLRMWTPRHAGAELTTLYWAKYASCPHTGHFPGRGSWHWNERGGKWQATSPSDAASRVPCHPQSEAPRHSLRTFHGRITDAASTRKVHCSFVSCSIIRSASPFPRRRSCGDASIANSVMGVLSCSGHLPRPRAARLCGGPGKWERTLH
jgi:hypothetical protein